MPKKITSLNPFSTEVNGQFDALSPAQAERGVQRCREAYAAWRTASAEDRGERIGKLAQVLTAGRRGYAETITKEMGKPIRQSLLEIDRCAAICGWFAEHAGELTRNEVVAAPYRKSYVSFAPLGVILAVMPWNFPMIQALRFAIPTMTAGNVVALKPASIVPLCGLALEGMFAEAGFPPGAFTTLLMDSQTTQHLIRTDQVDGVSLTGSLTAGCEIGSAAGARIRKVVLELGGSDPFIVLDNGDVDAAAATAVQLRFVNCGQSCVAAKRFIVAERVVEDFSERFIHHLRAMRIGDPMDESTDLGPLARAEFREELSRQVDDARRKGAVIVDGPLPPAGGAFFRPVVVLKATPDMAVAREETFGPIAPIFSVRDDEEAVRLANATEFGLGATIWSRDIERAEQMAARIDAGFVGINQPVKSDPRLPFGGTKKSGLGRELSYYGVREFTNVKTVIVQDPK